MANQYYIVIDGNSTGPYTREELLSRGVTGETMVWREGMSEWAPASSVPELADLFQNAYPGSGHNGGYPQPPYGQSYNPHPSYNQPTYNQGQYNQAPQTRQTPPTNWLTWAIIGTIVGFFTTCIGAIFGIIGIVQANKANTFYAAGDYVNGDIANSTAKTMTIISLVFCGIGIIGTILLLGSYSVLLSSLAAL